MILSTLENRTLTATEIAEPTYTHTCDVLVVGAGAAGCYAADAAASLGARVVLLEYGKNIGGMPVCGNVTGYYYGTPGGTFEEDDTRRKTDRTFLTYASWEARQTVLTERLEKSGITLLCACSPTGVLCTGDRVVGLTYFDGERETAISARITVDATSDGHLLRMLPVKKYYGRPDDGLTVPFTVRTQYTENGRFFSDNTDSGIVNQYDSRAFSRAAVLSHAAAARHLVPGQEFINLALRTGVREGLTFEGEETLSYRDLLLGKKPERVLFYAYSDLDRHGHERALDEELFQNWWVVAGLATVLFRIPVPMGAICPRGIRGIVTAGRALAADTYISSAVRMNRDMFRMGECVGCAAALAVRDGVDITDIPYEEYVRIVDGRGAFAGERDLTMGFDESYAVYLKKMNALGRAPDPRYADFTPASRVYIPVDLPHTDVEKALHTDAPGAGIFATYLGYGNMSADRLAEDMLGDGDRLYRYNCAITLGLLGDARAIPVLSEIVRERDCFFFTNCRRSNQFRTSVAICLLGRLGGEECVPMLLSLLREEEFEAPMYHTLAPDYLYYARDDRNFVYFDVMTHTLAALLKIYRRHGLSMEDYRACLEAFLSEDAFLSRVTAEEAGSSTYEEVVAFCRSIRRLAAD
ncbi:MAG: FAD-dependent oxidoreductase [Clostridia bacterium]|nr:FAD-dependent oxidoreductase [Clostridia bacterium]